MGKKASADLVYLAGLRWLLRVPAICCYLDDPEAGFCTNISRIFSTSNILLILYHIHDFIQVITWTNAICNKYTTIWDIPRLFVMWWSLNCRLKIWSFCKILVLPSSLTQTRIKCVQYRTQCIREVLNQKKCEISHQGGGLDKFGSFSHFLDAIASLGLPLSVRDV